MVVESKLRRKGSRREGPADRDDIRLPRLIEVLENHSDLQYLAVLELANMGPAAAPVLSHLEGFLLDSRDELVVASLYALGKMGDAARPAVEEILLLVQRADAPEIQMYAAWALVQIELNQVDQLVRLYNQGPVTSRIYCLWQLGKLGYCRSAALEVLEDALKQPFPGMQKYAAWGIGKMGSGGTSSFPALLEAVQSDHREVSQSAVWALEQMGDSVGRSLKSLAQKIHRWHTIEEDELDQWKEQLLHIITHTHLPWEPMKKPLLRGLDHPHLEVRQVVKELLGAMANDDTSALGVEKSHLRREVEKVREQVLNLDFVSEVTPIKSEEELVRFVKNHVELPGKMARRPVRGKVAKASLSTTEEAYHDREKWAFDMEEKPECDLIEPPKGWKPSLWMEISQQVLQKSQMERAEMVTRERALALVGGEEKLNHWPALGVITPKMGDKGEPLFSRRELDKVAERKDGTRRPTSEMSGEAGLMNWLAKVGEAEEIARDKKSAIYMTRAEVLEELVVEEGHLKDLIHRGELTPQIRGGREVFYRSEVEEVAEGDRGDEGISIEFYESSDERARDLMGGETTGEYGGTESFDLIDEDVSEEVAEGGDQTPEGAGEAVGLGYRPPADDERMGGITRADQEEPMAGLIGGGGMGYGGEGVEEEEEFGEDGDTGELYLLDVDEDGRLIVDDEKHKVAPAEDSDFSTGDFSSSAKDKLDDFFGDYPDLPAQKPPASPKSRRTPDTTRSSGRRASTLEDTGFFEVAEEVGTTSMMGVDDFNGGGGGSAAPTTGMKKSIDIDALESNELKLSSVSHRHEPEKPRDITTEEPVEEADHDFEEEDGLFAGEVGDDLHDMFGEGDREIGGDETPSPADERDWATRSDGADEKRKIDTATSSGASAPPENKPVIDSLEEVDDEPTPRKPVDFSKLKRSKLSTRRKKSGGLGGMLGAVGGKVAGAATGGLSRGVKRSATGRGKKKKALPPVEVQPAPEPSPAPTDSKTRAGGYTRGAEEQWRQQARRERERRKGEELELEVDDEFDEIYPEYASDDMSFKEKERELEIDKLPGKEKTPAQFIDDQEKKIHNIKIDMPSHEDWERRLSQFPEEDSLLPDVDRERELTEFSQEANLSPDEEQERRASAFEDVKTSQEAEDRVLASREDHETREFFEQRQEVLSHHLDVESGGGEQESRLAEMKEVVPSQEAEDKVRKLPPDAEVSRVHDDKTRRFQDVVTSREAEDKVRRLPADPQVEYLEDKVAKKREVAPPKIRYNPPIPPRKFEKALSEDGASPGALEGLVAKSATLMKMAQITLGLKFISVAIVVDNAIDSVATYVRGVTQAWKSLRAAKKRYACHQKGTHLEELHRDFAWGRYQLGRLFSFPGFDVEEQSENLPAALLEKNPRKSSFPLKMVLETRRHLDEMKEDLSFVTASSAKSSAQRSMFKFASSLVPSPARLLMPWKDFIILLWSVEYTREEIEDMYLNLVLSYRRLMIHLRDRHEGEGKEVAPHLVEVIEELDEMEVEMLAYRKKRDHSEDSKNLAEVTALCRKSVRRLLIALTSPAQFIDLRKWDRKELVQELQRTSGYQQAAYLLELERWLTRVVSQAMKEKGYRPDMKERNLRFQEQMDFYSRYKLKRKIRERFV